MELMQKVSHSRSFRLRGTVGAFLLLPACVAVLFSTPTVRAGSLLDWACHTCGWFLLAVYATFRMWATIYVGGRKDRILQTEGVYSATRNPLYLGSACLALAAVLFFESALLLLLTGVLVAFYFRTVIRSEEDVLRHRFGAAFDDYTRATPRFIPSFSRYRRTTEVTVNFDALRREAHRLWGAAVLPIVAELVALLRNNEHWPHWFQLV